MAARPTELGTTRNHRLPRQQRRAQLLAAAQEVFVEKGYHAAGMEDIADQAGVSKPVLYQHFPGKLELYLALVDQHTAALVASVEDALASTEDHKDRVYASIVAYFDFVAREGSAYRLVFESDLTEVVSVRERIRWSNRACAEAVARRIVIDTGLAEDVALLLGQALTGMAAQSAMAWLRESSVPKETAARLVGHLAWRGVGNYPTRALTGADRSAGATAP